MSDPNVIVTSERVPASLQAAQDIIASDPYPGTGPVDYSTGKPYVSPEERGLLVGRTGPDLLAAAALKRKEGASLEQVRQALCLDGMHVKSRVSDAVLERAVDGAGALILEHLITSKPVEKRRVWGGMDPLPSKAEYEARLLRAQGEGEEEA